MALLAGWVCLAGWPAVLRGQQTGSIVGVVTLTSKTRGAALSSPMYPSRTVSAQTPPAAPEITNVVVHLKNAEFRGTLPIARAELRQHDEMFVPHVLAITKGSTVAFTNDDKFYHNVFSLSGAATFDLGRYPEGQAKSFTFQTPGLVKVFCHLHSQMSASILVLDNPFFTTPIDDGRFVLKDLPPGEYTLVAWHERVGERTVTLRVEAGKATTANLSLPIGESR